MLPYKLLSEKDKEDLKAFCDLQANFKLDGMAIELEHDMRDVLASWDKGKRTLCKLLGGKLRHTFKAKLYADEKIIVSELSGLYDSQAACICHPMRLEWTYEVNDKNRFVYEFTNFLAKHAVAHKEEHGSIWEQVFDCAYHINNLFSYRAIINNRVFSPFYLHDPISNKVVKFESGMKTIRAIKKLADFVGYECGESFAAWRDTVSEITTNKSDLEINVTLSVHPIDYLTMSDNGCGWTSCMASLSGCFSNGTIEMMNSNMVIVAYVTSRRTPMFKYGSTSYPNKSWRCLYYVNKDIICSGRQYPYDNMAVEKACLDEIKMLAKENLGWYYTYGPQEYHDDEVFYNNSYIRNGVREKHGEHKIFFYTYAAMYNDLYRGEFVKHCYRNYVTKTKKLCVSGPCTCLNCGKPISTPRNMYFSKNDDEEVDSRGDTPFCFGCEVEIYKRKKGWLHARKL